MDALAETWHHSGRKPEDLFKGKTEEILEELRDWLAARVALNAAIMDLLWDLFGISDSIFILRNRLGSLQDIRIAPFKAKYVKAVERVEDFKQQRDRLTQRAFFLVSTMRHRRFKWPKMPCRSQWSEADAEVCACLKSQEERLDAEKQLELLEMENEITAWHMEYESREAGEATSSIPGLSVDDYSSTNHERRPTGVRFGDQGTVRTDTTHENLADPVDVSGLIPPRRPHSEDSPTRSLSSVSLSTLEDDPLEAEESAEAIALRINSMSVTGQKPQVEKKSKTKKRNLQRKKAKARAKGAAKEESLTTGDESVLPG